MEVSGHLHALTILPLSPGKEHPVHIE